MELVVTPISVAGILLGALNLTLAGVVFWAGPGRRLNRLLALVLSLVGVAIMTGSGLMYLVDDYGAALGFQMVSYVCIAGQIATYPIFMGAALSSPLVAPFRARAVQALLVLAGAAGAGLVVLRSDLFSAGLYRPAYGAWENLGGPGSTAIFRLVTFVSLFGIIAAVDAWRRSPRGTPQRQRAGLYAAAFGCQDTAYAIYGGFYAIDISDRLSAAVFWVATVLLLLFAAIFTYAILKAQLFDIDLKIKATVRRSAVASAFLGMFLVSTQLAQNVLSDQLGIVVGGLAAGFLLFALTPLQRAADRLANAAMPSVSDSEAYLAFRKLQVYRDAVESFALDGQLSAREQGALDRLRQKLGLSDALVLRIHQDTGVDRASLQA